MLLPSVLSMLSVFRHVCYTSFCKCWDRYQRQLWHMLSNKSNRHADLGINKRILWFCNIAPGTHPKTSLCRYFHLKDFNEVWRFEFFFRGIHLLDSYLSFWCTISMWMHNYNKNIHIMILWELTMCTGGVRMSLVGEVRGSLLQLNINDYHGYLITLSLLVIFWIYVIR